MSTLRQLIESVFEGDAATVASSMADAPVVQDQRLGRVAGLAGVERWVEDSATWLAGLAAQPTEVSLIETARRSVCELSLSIETSDGRVDLPYVVVADHTAGGFSELRTYHSTWPYTGGHVFRAPPLAGRTPEPIPDIFQWYIDRVTEADVEAVLGRFTPDGYVREPSGDRWKHAGPQGRAAFYGHLVHAPRARFELMTSTADEQHIAVEYAFAYGDNALVGGICILEVAGDHIAAVRITDDVSV